MYLTRHGLGTNKSPLPFGFNRVPDKVCPVTGEEIVKSPLPFGFNRVPDLENLMITETDRVEVSIAFRLQPRS